MTRSVRNERARAVWAALWIGGAALVVGLAGCGGDETKEASTATADWPYYGGDEGGQRHSP
jgi:hypothetical protein